MKFCIIGGGWYGCHVGNYLRHLGFDVTLHERNSSIFLEASGNNQNRLHLGFHYARDYDTRLQSRDGYNRFIERYSAFSKPIANNLYAVPKTASLIDFKTYKAIMASTGIEFAEVPLDQLPFPINNVSGVINTRERVLDNEKAKQYFSKTLKDVIRLESEITLDQIDQTSETEIIVAGERYDFLIDATWGKLFPLDQETFFEPTLLLYYKSTISDFALTMVDGQLCSIYPTAEDGIVTLSSVTHTPLGTYKSHTEAQHRLDSLSDAEIGEIRGRMEAEITEYFPDFADVYSYVGPQRSVKTKPVGMQDNRACYVSQKGRVFKVLSGKIDTIFVAAERIISSIAEEETPWMY